MQDLMNGRAPSKSWDDVFPDDHAIEFPAPNLSDGYSFDFGGHVTPARHWRPSRYSTAAGEEDTPSSWNVSPQSFKKFTKDFKCMQKGLRRRKNQSKKNIRDSLEKDVAILESEFHCELAARKVLEQAIGKASSVTSSTICNFTSKSTQDLIREIAMLELEVAHLEQHLLALYRKAFDQTLNGFSYGPKERDMAFSSKLYDYHGQQPFSESAGEQINSSSRSYHNQFVVKSLQDNPRNSHHLFDSTARQSTEARTVSKTDRNLHASFSQPIFFPQKEEECFLQLAKDEQQDISIKGTPLQEIYSEKHVDSSSPLFGEPICKTPNRLSEDLVCCMAAIYCKLAEPPLPNLRGLMSPSSSSSASTFSTQRFSSDGWTSQCKTDGSCDVSLGDPSQETSALEYVRASSSTVEVHWICVDNERLTYAARMLRSFRLLVQQLERVDPSKMKHEQKLAFWINIHNALMMHAYLAYGIPRNHLKRLSLLHKAAYKIGAHSINAQTIEQTILRCRWHRPAKWLESILSPAAKLRAGERQAYAIDHPEPLICFALCCGGRSDPMVRVYTEQSIHKELEVAKREFLQANVRIRKETKIQLPKVLESFARESSVGTAHLPDWICQNLQEETASSIASCLAKAADKPLKCIEWLPYDFTFRYVFMNPLSIWIRPA